MKRLFLTFAVLGGLLLSSFTTKIDKAEPVYLVTITNSCGMTSTYGVTDSSFYDVACYWEEMCD